MYKEVVKRQGNTGIISILLVVFIFVFMSILDTLFARFKYLIIGDLIMLLLFIILGYIVLQYFVAYFEYTLADTDLIFSKIIGRRETVVLHVNMQNVLMIAPLSSSVIEKYKTTRTYDVSIAFSGNKKYCMIVENHGKLCKLIFEPSKKFIQILKDNLPDKVF